MFSMQSSNPALTNQDAFNPYAYGGEAPMVQERANVTTLAGVVNKTALLVLIAVAAGAVGYSLLIQFPGLLWVTAIASFVLVLGFGFLVCRRPQAAVVIAPIYAVIEGLFLGGVTRVADVILANEGLAVLGGVGAQAFVITMASVASMLGLYKAGIIRPTERFKSVIFTLTGAIMLAYLVAFVMMFFGVRMPLISFPSAVAETGMMGLLGLGINLFILVIASLFLIIDFGEVEKHIEAGSPKHMEWYLGFALLITLAWIYFEAVKLVVRLALIFGNRD